MPILKNIIDDILPILDNAITKTEKDHHVYQNQKILNALILARTVFDKILKLIDNQSFICPHKPPPNSKCSDCVHCISCPDNNDIPAEDLAIGITHICHFNNKEFEDEYIDPNEEACAYFNTKISKPILSSYPDAQLLINIYDDTNRSVHAVFLSDEDTKEYLEKNSFFSKNDNSVFYYHTEYPQSYFILEPWAPYNRNNKS